MKLLLWSPSNSVNPGLTVPTVILQIYVSRFIPWTLYKSASKYFFQKTGKFSPLCVIGISGYVWPCQQAQVNEIHSLRCELNNTPPVMFTRTSVACSLKVLLARLKLVEFGSAPQAFRFLQYSACAKLIMVGTYGSYPCAEFRPNCVWNLTCT